MRIALTIVETSTEVVSRVGKVLSNPNRVLLLSRFNSVPQMTLAQAHEWAEQHDIYDNEPSTYRALERLVESDLLRKTYDGELKKIIYSVLDSVEF